MEEGTMKTQWNLPMAGGTRTRSKSKTIHEDLVEESKNVDSHSQRKRRKINTKHKENEAVGGKVVGKQLSLGKHIEITITRKLYKESLEEGREMADLANRK